MNKHLWVYIVLIIILGLSSTLGYISTKLIGEEVVYVMAKDQSLTQDLFKMEDIKKLESSQSTVWISYAYKTTKTLSKENRKCKVKLIITDEDYRRWNKLLLKTGHFLLTDSYRKNQLVLEDKIAFKLFGSSAALKDTIAIEGKNYEVIGTVSQTQFKGWQIGEKEIIGEGYVLGNAKEEYKDLLLSGIVVGGLTGQKLEDRQIVKQLLMQLGRDNKAYEVISLNQYSNQILTHGKLLMNSMALMFMSMGWVLVGEWVCRTLKHIRETLKTCYFKECLIKKRRELIKVTSLCSIVIIITVILGSNFLRGLLQIVVQNEVSIGAIQGLPDSIKALKYMNQISRECLYLGELLVGVNLICYIRKIVIHKRRLSDSY